MRDILAERLLAKVLNWVPEDVARERPILQALGDLKYDEYQQFSPGMRFVESLALWLAQFESIDQRRQAYEYIRVRLVYISRAEMGHLVSMAYQDFIRPLLIHNAALLIGLPDKFVRRIVKSCHYKVLLRQSLFLGLSDGAHTDLFRRSNADEISHEQVFQTYEISASKTEDLLVKLSSDLEQLLQRKPIETERKFRFLFLLDDFSGSGLTYARKDDGNLKYTGKIHKFLNDINSSEHSKNLFDLPYLSICIVLYIATDRAVSHIKDYMDNWSRENGGGNSWAIRVIYPIHDSMNLSEIKDKAFTELCQKYFDPGILDEHYRKGRYEKPYLGFDECALPIVLNHNTPNNSLPLLWFEEDRKYRGLFPRISRHR